MGGFRHQDEQAHLRIVAEQDARLSERAAQAAENQAKIRLAREAKQGGLPKSLPAPADHWLVDVAAAFGQFSQLAANSEAWRAKICGGIDKFGWSRADVAAMMSGFERDRAERESEGTLSADVSAFRFPQAQHVFSSARHRQGETRRPWHGPQGESWAEWAYRRWAQPKIAASDRPAYVGMTAADLAYDGEDD